MYGFRCKVILFFDISMHIKQKTQPPIDKGCVYAVLNFESALRTFDKLRAQGP